MANKLNIDWDLVDDYFRAGCSGALIAHKLGISEKTLSRRCNDEKQSDMSAYKQQKRAEGDDVLRYAQYKNAEEGNTSMQIWLGKQRLGQKDKQEQTNRNISIVIDADDENL